MACTKEPDGFEGRLEALSMKQRAVFLLRELDGMDHDAIAHRLGISRALVAVQLRVIFCCRSDLAIINRLTKSRE